MASYQYAYCMDGASKATALRTTMNGKGLRLFYTLWARLKLSIRPILFTFLVFTTPQYLLADSGEPEIISLMSEFSNKIYVLGETTGGSKTEWKQAERETLERFREIAQKNPSELTEKSQSDDMPLHYASLAGYTFLVKEFLKHPSVIEQIDAQNDQGLSAYAAATLAMQQSFLACHPKSENPFWLIPKLVTLPYYDNRNPYKKIQKLLKRNEANTNEDRARKFWLEGCSNQDSSQLEKVKNSSNLRKTLIKIHNQNAKALWND